MQPIGCKSLALCAAFALALLSFGSSELTITIASKRFSNLSEGPFWDPHSQTLLFVDLFVGDVCRLDPESGETEVIHFDQATTFVIPYTSNPNKMVISVGKEVHELNWDTKTSKDLVVLDTDKEGNRCNDAKADYHGRLWVGTFKDEVNGVGSLYRIERNLKVRRTLDKLNIPNGITWSLDNRKMFFIDTEVRRIYVFDYDIDTGHARNQRVLFDFNSNSAYRDFGNPDGMTIDNKGKLWVACFDGGRIVRIDPAKGKIIRVVHLPVSKVTSVAFGGPHYDILYVTTAKRDLTPEQQVQQPLAGAIFKITGLGVRGRPAFTFGR